MTGLPCQSGERICKIIIFSFVTVYSYFRRLLAQMAYSGPATKKKAKQKRLLPIRCSQYILLAPRSWCTRCLDTLGGLKAFEIRASCRWDEVECMCLIIMHKNTCQKSNIICKFARFKNNILFFILNFVSMYFHLPRLLTLRHLLH